MWKFRNSHIRAIAYLSTVSNTIEYIIPFNSIESQYLTVTLYTPTNSSY